MVLASSGRSSLAIWADSLISHLRVSASGASAARSAPVAVEQTSAIIRWLRGSSAAGHNPLPRRSREARSRDAAGGLDNAASTTISSAARLLLDVGGAGRARSSASSKPSARALLSGPEGSVSATLTKRAARRQVSSANLARNERSIVLIRISKSLIRKESSGVGGRHFSSAKTEPSRHCPKLKPLTASIGDIQPALQGTATVVEGAPAVPWPASTTAPPHRPCGIGRYGRQRPSAGFPASSERFGKDLKAILASVAVFLYGAAAMALIGQIDGIPKPRGRRPQGQFDRTG